MLDERDLPAPVATNIQNPYAIVNEREFPYRYSHLTIMNSSITDGYNGALNTISYSPQGVVRQHTRPNFFHYTTLVNFENIVRSGCFWASPLGCMNDSGELNYARSLLETKLRFDIKSFDAPDDITNKIINHIVEYYSSYASHGIYCISFSKRGNLLSQWVKYSGKGGVSFSINTLVLDSLVCVNRGVHFSEVNYNLRYHYETIEDISMRIAENWRNLTSKESAFKYLNENFRADFFKIMTTFKHQDFSEEEEVRFLIDGGLNLEIIKERNDGRKYVNFNFRKAFIITQKADYLYEYVFVAPTQNEKKELNKVGDIMRKNRIKFGFIIGGRSPYVWPVQ